MGSRASKESQKRDPTVGLPQRERERAATLPQAGIEWTHQAPIPLTQAAYKTTALGIDNKCSQDKKEMI